MPPMLQYETSIKIFYSKVLLQGMITFLHIQFVSKMHHIHPIPLYKTIKILFNTITFAYIMLVYIFAI